MSVLGRILGQMSILRHLGEAFQWVAEMRGQVCGEALFLYFSVPIFSLYITKNLDHCLKHPLFPIVPLSTSTFAPRNPPRVKSIK